jgi:two-component system, NarL family, sensor kinase
LQEIITNILKHAQASNVYISAKVAHEKNCQDEVIINVKDDGQGFDASTQTRGRGYANINTRLSRIGAKVTLKTLPGQGTSYEIRLPTAAN